MAERNAHHHFGGIGCLSGIGSMSNNNNNNVQQHSATSTQMVTSTTAAKPVRNPSVISSSPPRSPSPPPPANLPTSTTAPSFPSPHVPMLLHHPSHPSPIKGPSDVVLSGNGGVVPSSSSSLSGSFLLNAAVQHLPALHLWPTLHLQDGSAKNPSTVMTALAKMAPNQF